MFTQEGNQEVAALMMRVREYFEIDSSATWAFVQEKLKEISTDERFEEATDTDVNERCFSWLLFRESEIKK
jgi:hypothetical protein